MIQEKEVGIKGIPGLVITSGEKAKGVVLFYHGWSSQKEFQAVRSPPSMVYMPATMSMSASSSILPT